MAKPTKEALITEAHELGVSVEEDDLYDDILAAVKQVRDAETDAPVEEYHEDPISDDEPAMTVARAPRGWRFDARGIYH